MTGKLKNFCKNLGALFWLLASIIFVMGGFFWFFPWFINKTQNWLLIGVAVIVLIPVFSVVSGFLQGEQKSFKGFLNEYFNTDIELFLKFYM